MIAAAVDTNALLQTIVAALVAGVGTTLVFSLAILGAARFGEASRDGRGLESALYGGLAVVALLATVGAVVAAMIVMSSKG